MSKQISIEEQVAQEVAKLNRQFELKQEQRETNKVSIGARVVDLKILEGKPVIDKVTNQQKLVNGVPQNYQDKYYVTLQFLGSSLETEVKTRQVYDSFELHKTYFCEGYLGEVKKFGDSQLEPIFTTFTKL